MITRHRLFNRKSVLQHTRNVIFCREISFRCYCLKRTIGDTLIMVLKCVIDIVVSLLFQF